MRSFLYRIARLMGDISAVGKGKIGQRMFNKLVGRKLVSRMWLRGTGCIVPIVAGVLLVWAVVAGSQ